MRGSSLEMLARRYMEVQAIIRRWARRYDERLLEQLIYVPEVTPARLRQLEFMRGWIAELERQLNARSAGRSQFKLELRSGADGQAPRVLVVKTEHGVTVEKLLHHEFFESTEYHRIAELGRTLGELLKEGAYVTRGSESEKIASFKQAMDWLFAQARKGQTI